MHKMWTTSACPPCCSPGARSWGRWGSWSSWGSGSSSGRRWSRGLLPWPPAAHPCSPWPHRSPSPPGSAWSCSLCWTLAGKQRAVSSELPWAPPALGHFQHCVLTKRDTCSEVSCQGNSWKGIWELTHGGGALEIPRIYSALGKPRQRNAGMFMSIISPLGIWRRFTEMYIHVLSIFMEIVQFMEKYIPSVCVQKINLYFLLFLLSKKKILGSNRGLTATFQEN